MKASGTFEVNLSPQPLTIEHDSSLNAGRMNIDKTFEGPLQGKTSGEMLSVMNGERSAGGYVAIEIFKGSLNGLSGSFAFQHYGKFDSSDQSLLLEVVPGSGEGDLVGISGKMIIRNEGKQHYYDFDGEV